VALTLRLCVSAFGKPPAEREQTKEQLYERLRLRIFPIPLSPNLAHNLNPLEVIANIRDRWLLDDPLAH